MAGNIRGRVECYSSGNQAVISNEIFTSWYKCMEIVAAAGVCERIALQYGDTGTGPNYHDEANPFSNHCSAVYRFPANANRSNDFYVRAVASDTAAGTNAAPIRVGGQFTGNVFMTFAFASALESDGTTNADPWANATRNNDGTDLTGLVAGTGPVWQAPVGGTLAVWPVSNEAGGSFATNKEDTVPVLYSGSASLTCRYGFIFDDDNFFAYVDAADSLFEQWVWFGPIIPNGLISDSNLKYKLGLLSKQGAVGIGSIYGSSSGSASENAGFFSPSEQLMRRAMINADTLSLDSGVQPSTITGVTAYEEMALTFRGADAGSLGNLGMLDPSFIRAVEGIPCRSTLNLSRYVHGSNSTLDRMVTTPWDPAISPGSGVSRDGTDFVVVV